MLIVRGSRNKFGMTISFGPQRASLVIIVNKYIIGYNNQPMSQIPENETNTRRQDYAVKESPTVDDVPDVFISSAWEARALGLAQTLHGTTGAALIAEDLRYNPTNDTRLDGIFSFHLLWLLDVPEVAWPRKELYRSSKPGPNMTKSTNLWVAASRSNHLVDYRVWREASTHANYSARNRAFDYRVNSTMVSALQDQLVQLREAIQSNGALYPEQMQYVEVSDELELQMRRKAIWKRTTATEKELIGTPAVLEWHLWPSELLQENGVKASVLDGYVPFSRLRVVYLPDTISPSAEHCLQEKLHCYGSRGKLIKTGARLVAFEPLSEQR